MFFCCLRSVLLLLKIYSSTAEDFVLLEVSDGVLESDPLILPLNKVALQLLFGGPLDCCDSAGTLLLLLLLCFLEVFDGVLESFPLALPLCPMALQLLFFAADLFSVAEILSSAVEDFLLLLKICSSTVEDLFFYC